MGEADELVDDPWSVHDEQIKATGYFAMLRALPALVAQVLKVCWQTSRIDTIVMVSLTVISEAFTAVGLLATRGVLEQLFATGPTPERIRQAVPSLMIVAIAALLRFAFQQGGQLANARLRPQVERVAEQRLLERTTAVELVAFDDAGFHDKVHRVRQTGVRAIVGLLYYVLSLLSGAIGFIAVAGTLGVLHPILLPLILLAVVPDGWAAVRSARQGYRLSQTLAAAYRRKETLAELMTERTPAAEIRSYTLRPFLLNEHARLATKVQQAELQLELQQVRTSILGSSLSGVALLTVYVVLGVLLWTGAVPLAIGGTAVLAIQTARGSLGTVMGAVSRCYEEGLYFEDYLAFCREAEERAPKGTGQEPPNEIDRISVTDVHFSYPQAQTPALQGVSIEIHPGEIIALVGENGSGKTTLAKILSGLYEPAKGTITYGGAAGIDRDRLREHIAVIAQDFTHWPFTAGENITIGRYDQADPARLQRAAQSSGVDELVERLQMGYRTLLDPAYRGGTELSGGQWQRIAVARGLYRDAPLLICDEPTAALDARTEHAIFEAIRRHAVQRTVVLITHRLASVRYADRIYVLDKGIVAEHGTHAELMAGNGIYAEFYGLQARAYT